MEYKRFNGRSYEYLLPKEIIKSPYNGSKVQVKLGQDNWVPQRCIIRLLSSCCKLTLQQYYDLVILGITDQSQRPKCLYCGKYLEFSGKLSHGYGHHPNSDQDKLFCSRSHNAQYHHDHPDYNKNWSSTAGFKNTVSKTHRSQFLNSGNPDDICVLYLAKRKDGSIKYGVSADIYSRIRRSKNRIMRDEIPYLLVKVLVTGPRSSIANLEYGFKLITNNREILDGISDVIKLKYYIMEELTIHPELILTPTTIS